MKSFIFGLLALFSVSLGAAEMPLVAKLGDTEVKIFLEPCTTKAGIFATLDDANRPDWQRAEVIYKGKQLIACWTVRGPSSVVIVDESGDGGEIPATAFQKADVI